jgi:hypothetical protein
MSFSHHAIADDDVASAAKCTACKSTAEAATAAVATAAVDIAVRKSGPRQLNSKTQVIDVTSGFRPRNFGL